MTSPADESENAGSNRSGKEVLDILAKMYARPPRGPILDIIWDWIAKTTPRVIDFLTVWVLMIMAGLGAGVVGVKDNFGIVLFSSLLLWPVCRLGIWYDKTHKELKRLERLEYMVQYELEPEIERLKEQVREYSQKHSPRGEA